jgi:hypothetical protein
MGLVLANVLAIFAPAVAFVLIFLTLCVLLKVARDVAHRPPWRRLPQRRRRPFYLLSPIKRLRWRLPVAISAVAGGQRGAGAP